MRRAACAEKGRLAAVVRAAAAAGVAAHPDVNSHAVHARVGQQLQRRREPGHCGIAEHALSVDLAGEGREGGEGP